MGRGATIVGVDLNPSDHADSSASAGSRIRARGVADSTRNVPGRATRVGLSMPGSGAVAIPARPPQFIPLQTVRELAWMARDSLAERVLRLHGGILYEGLREGLRFEHGTGSNRIRQGPGTAEWGLDRKSIASRMVALGSKPNAR